MSVKTQRPLRLASALIVHALLQQSLVAVTRSFSANYHDPELEAIKPVQLKIEQGIESQSEWSALTIYPRFINDSLSVNYQPRYALIETVIVPEATKRISNMLMAKGRGFIPLQQETPCDKITQLSDPASSESINAHMLANLLIGSYNSTWLASGTVCAVAEGDNRPVISFIKINIDNVSWGLREIEESIKEVVGQFFHVVAFSGQVMQMYPVGFSSMFQLRNDSSSNSSSSEYYEVISKGVLERARRYFDCSTLTGIPMRINTNKTANGHFSQFFMINELMSGEDFGYKVISEFTLAFLADSGWYIADFSFAEQLSLGKGAGCDFFEAFNQNKTAFRNCNSTGITYCSEDYTSKSLCLPASIDEPNLIKKPVRGGHCVFDRSLVQSVPFESNSTNSRCFSVIGYGQNNTGCFESYCIDGVLNVTVNAANYSCTSAGQTLSFSNLVIICPDPKEFCEYRQACSGCSGNGVCLTNGKCRCNFMYEGDQCEKQKQCDLDAPNVCGSIKDFGTFLTYEIVYKAVTIQAIFVGFVSFLLLN